MIQDDNDDFFAGVEDESENSPEFVKNRVTNLANEHGRIMSALGDAEAEVSRLKGLRDEIELKKLPDALMEAGLSEITMLDGRKVKTQIHVGAVPAEAKPAFFKWLDDHGHGSIIKRQVAVSFDKGSTAAAVAAEAAIRELGLEPKTSLDVHYQTWKSFAKEQTNKGNSIPFDQFGIYFGQKAVIK